MKKLSLFRFAAPLLLAGAADRLRFDDDAEGAGHGRRTASTSARTA
jgi:hypothetical protein